MGKKVKIGLIRRLDTPSRAGRNHNFSTIQSYRAPQDFDFGAILGPLIQPLVDKRTDCVRSGVNRIPLCQVP